MKPTLSSAQSQLQLINERIRKTPSASLKTGIQNLDGFLHGFLSSELIILYGSPFTYALTDQLAARSQLPVGKGSDEGDVLYIDGGNCFNLYRISELTRRLGMGVRESLQNIRLSRAFTSQQLATLIVRELDVTLSQHPSKLVVVSDLLSIARDEEVDAGEARNMLNLAICSLRQITSHKKLVTLLAMGKLSSAERNALQLFIWPKADIIIRIHQLRHRIRISREKHPLGEGEIELDLESLPRELELLKPSIRDSMRI